MPTTARSHFSGSGHTSVVMGQADVPQLEGHLKVSIPCAVRGRSKVSTFMKAYARGRDRKSLYDFPPPRKSTLKCRLLLVISKNSRVSQEIADDVGLEKIKFKVRFGGDEFFKEYSLYAFINVDNFERQHTVPCFEMKIKRHTN